MAQHGQRHSIVKQGIAKAERCFEWNGKGGAEPRHAGNSDGRVKQRKEQQWHSKALQGIAKALSSDAAFCRGRAKKSEGLAER